MFYKSYQQIRADLDGHRITVVQIVNHHLGKIEEKNPNLNAFLEVYREESITKAAQIDLKLKQGTAGRLAGLVVGIKDLFCLKGHLVSCSSKILEDFESQITATPIQRLLDEDAIVIGRQNCDEFAMGSSNENSAFGLVKNGANPSRVPGGSSGGSAVGVQTDMCQISLGSDTGGSVRQPAAFCGVYGLKPTYSRISRYGLTAYSSSFDCVGVFSKSISDAELILEIIAGSDEQDATSSRKKVPYYSQSFIKLNRYKIAYFAEINEAEGIANSVSQMMSQTMSNLKASGHLLEQVSFPYLEYLLPTYYILTSAEASANLARFDGVRYGFRDLEISNLDSMYKKSRTNGFGSEVLRRILLGTFVLSSSYHDAFYTKAQKVRRLIKDYTDDILKEYDFIISPTTATTAFKINSKTVNPVEMYLSDLFTVQASVAGIPAISIPMGKDQNAMPIGLQVMAASFEEEKLFSFAKSFKPK
ncbi:MAG: Asp-tRNA(Asn)/Glu-tRNA(Gln) amidotransferase GatCAB subunit A [Flammeovirgaceae bacterium]|nr:Asp-tRNA(Asn)/Glu-tRNA(Gln) amidotransferase GatCAB subunit A [Flammeovirgaceae bacterium]